MSTGARLGILAAIIIAAVVVLVAVGGGSDKKSSTTTTTATAARTTTGTSSAPTATTGTPPATVVVVKNAKPVSGVKKIEVNKGDQIKFVVKSDTADEIHVHGYDFHKDVPAGGQVAFSFPATIDGQFEVELENHKEQIAELTVQP